MQNQIKHSGKRVTSDQQFWLWVTRPDFYLDGKGSDRSDLDPESGIDTDGWWTCHKDTRKGDLALLWRTLPRSDIGYLFQAGSDAYDISDEKSAKDQGWSYGCDYKPIFKFTEPVTLAEVNGDPYLEYWNALRANFHGMVFAFDRLIWERVNKLLIARNPRYREILDGVSGYISPSIDTEEKIETALANDLSPLRKHGYDLELRGRQVICTGQGGRIDLLCFDKKRRHFVIIELKNVKAGRQTFAQIFSYMGWVAKRLAEGRPVEGLVISKGYDNPFKSSVELARESENPIKQIDISELRLS